MSNESINHQDCSAYELAISAMLDGELSASEKDQLGDHLLQCESCRQTVRDFEGASKTLHAVYRRDLLHRKPTTASPRRSRTNYFIGMVAVAAAACFAIAVLWQPWTELETNLVTAQQIMVPMQELDQLSEEQEQDQELKLKTMELELRFLMLEIKQLENTPSRIELSSKAEDMMTRVRNQITTARSD